MSKIELTSGDVIEAVCKMLSGIATKGVLPIHRNALLRYYTQFGINVIPNRNDPAKWMFHFLTADRLEVQLEFDMLDLQEHGKHYLDTRLTLILDQLSEARKVRQEETRLTINTHEPPTALKPSVVAHNEVFH